MKPFNLREALKGAPVKLRGGRKAYIVTNIKELFSSPQTDRVLLGVYSHISDSNRFDGLVRWEVSGEVCAGAHLNEEPYDIVGMWEEPELTQEQILEKAYNENLKVTFDKAMFTNGYEVIAKTKEGKYILRNGSNHLTQVHEDMTNFRIYEEKPLTVSVTLPRPFTPTEGECYWYISAAMNSALAVYKGKYNSKVREIIPDGNYFRTREDAQAWLDAMKGALDE